MGQQVTDTGMTSPVDEKSRKTIADYVGDMVALEDHIEEALDRQLDMSKDDPVAQAAIRDFHTLVKANRERVRALQEEVGSTGGNPIKAVGSTVLGKAAGLVDKVRTEGISKSIRDDYTAFNLAAIGYTMLHTTAVALGNKHVAEVAEQNLTGYAGAIQKINKIIPQIVVAELTKDGHTVSGDATERTRKIVKRAWKITDEP